MRPIFNRTLPLAQYHGVTAAATLVHDDRVGLGKIFHLFRLPLGLEQACSEVLTPSELATTLFAFTANQELAMTRLKELTSTSELAPEGAIALGRIDDIDTILARTATLYFSAFTQGIQTFPYFREVE
jgi:hypothetical protein